MLTVVIIIGCAVVGAIIVVGAVAMLGFSTVELSLVGLQKFES